MDRITLDRRIMNVAIAGIKSDMLSLHPMNRGQEQFFDYMVGARQTEPELPVVQALQVARDFLHVVDGFPIAATFEQGRFPAIRIAQRICAAYDKAILTPRLTAKKGKPKRRLVTQGARRR